MPVSEGIMIGVSINNVQGINGKTCTIHDLVKAGVEAEAMGFDWVWVHDVMMGRRTTTRYRNAPACRRRIRRADADTSSRLTS